MNIVADSSAIISAFVRIDQNHHLALKAKQRLKDVSGTIYLPSEVFAEILNIIGKKLNHNAAVRLAEGIFETEIFFIVPSNEDIRFSALRMFQKQPESVSFTDCIVMAFADAYETKDIFGFDESFRKNGYVRFGID